MLKETLNVDLTHHQKTALIRPKRARLMELAGEGRIKGYVGGNKAHKASKAADRDSPKHPNKKRKSTASNRKKRPPQKSSNAKWKTQKSNSNALRKKKQDCELQSIQGKISELSNQVNEIREILGNVQLVPKLLNPAELTTVSTVSMGMSPNTTDDAVTGMCRWLYGKETVAGSKGIETLLMAVNQAMRTQSFSANTKADVLQKVFKGGVGIEQMMQLYLDTKVGKGGYSPSGSDGLKNDGMVTQDGVKNAKSNTTNNTAEKKGLDVEMEYEEELATKTDVTKTDAKSDVASNNAKDSQDQAESCMDIRSEDDDQQDESIEKEEEKECVVLYRKPLKFHAGKGSTLNRFWCHLTQSLFNLELGSMNIKGNELLPSLADAVVHIDDTKFTKKKLVGHIMFFSPPVSMAHTEFGDQVDLNDEFTECADSVVMELTRFLERGEKEDDSPVMIKFRERASQFLSNQSVKMNKPCSLEANAPTKTGRVIRPEAAFDLVEIHKRRDNPDTVHLMNFIQKDGSKEEGVMNAWAYFDKESAERRKKGVAFAEIGIVATLKQESGEWFFHKTHEDSESVWHYSFIQQNKSIMDWDDQKKRFEEGRNAPVVCFKQEKYTHLGWVLQILINKKQVMYIPNVEIQHREWKGPSLIHVLGKNLTTHSCTVKEVGDVRAFCVCEDRRPNVAWVIVDREVLVQYESKVYKAVPAFLLCSNSADDWQIKMDKRRATLGRSLEDFDLTGDQSDRRE